MDISVRRGAGDYLEVVWPDGAVTDGPFYLYALLHKWVPKMRKGQQYPLTKVKA